MPKYYIFTLGCQMNVSDSERIAQKLEDLGYKSAPEKAADLVIINSCSVRQSAIDRIWGKIKIWQNQQKQILITGCLLKQDQNKFLNKNIRFFNINSLSKLGKIIINNFTGNNNDPNEYFNIPQKHADHKIAYIPIMTGCDNFCSYCAVPYTRGREVSRPEKEIISDIKKALKSGCKEILLLGQNVNSYKLKTQSSKFKTKTQNSKDNKDFIKLLNTIDHLPGDFKFNFMSSNPHDMSDELISCFACLKKWPRELHLAMQSGDDEILHKMNRKYTSNQFLQLVGKLKSQILNIRITTDIIVGFPTETKKQFENTYKVCQKIGFQKAYIAQYSPRPGTQAAKLKDDVPKLEKSRRWKILDSLINHFYTPGV